VKRVGGGWGERFDQVDMQSHGDVPVKGLMKGFHPRLSGRDKHTREKNLSHRYSARPRVYHDSKRKFLDTARGGARREGASGLSPPSRVGTVSSGYVEEGLNALYGAWALAPSYSTACGIGQLKHWRGQMRAAAESLSIRVEFTPAALSPRSSARPPAQAPSQASEP
jgi:hypothetical protein